MSIFNIPYNAMKLFSVYACDQSIEIFRMKLGLGKNHENEHRKALYMDSVRFQFDYERPSLLHDIERRNKNSIVNKKYHN